MEKTIQKNSKKEVDDFIDYICELHAEISKEKKKTVRLKNVRLKKNERSFSPSSYQLKSAWSKLCWLYLYPREEITVLLDKISALDKKGVNSKNADKYEGLLVELEEKYYISDPSAIKNEKFYGSFLIPSGLLSFNGDHLISLNARRAIIPILKKRAYDTGRYKFVIVDTYFPKENIEVDFKRILSANVNTKKRGGFGLHTLKSGPLILHALCFYLKSKKDIDRVVAKLFPHRQPLQYHEINRNKEKFNKISGLAPVILFG